MATWAMNVPHSKSLAYSPTHPYLRLISRVDRGRRVVPLPFTRRKKNFAIESLACLNEGGELESVPRIRGQSPASIYGGELQRRRAGEDRNEIIRAVDLNGRVVMVNSGDPKIEVLPDGQSRSRNLDEAEARLQERVSIQYTG